MIDRATPAAPPAPALRGLMMERPLLIASLLEHAVERHGDAEIVTALGGGRVHRSTYRKTSSRIARLAHALERKLGIRPGDRVATMAWNTYRHFEAYYAISGIGAVIHTLNPRLFKDQITYIVNHAKDRVLVLDVDFVPLLEPLAAAFPTIEAYVILCDAESMPATTLPNAIAYETLLDDMPETIAWPDFDENSASALCYTSGTTGNPKGVLYSHRSTVLHAFNGAITHSAGGGLGSVLPVVPMFHANAWGLPYTVPMLGGKLVFPSGHLDPQSLMDLFESERVTFTAGVPTIWFRLLAFMREKQLAFSTLRTVGIGGSAAPRAMIEEFERTHHVEVLHGWGMTETSPVATSGVVKAKHDTPELRIEYKTRAGRGVYGVDTRIVDDEDRVLPHDGEAQGELLVRGPWVASAYYEDPLATKSQFTADGWFRTGDIASIDDDGYITIRDRAKDVIKSGGEWISSIDLENVAVGHPEIVEAAAIGLPHPDWAERPLLVCIAAPQTSPTRESVLAYLDGKIVKWWMPDDVVFVDALPYTATGKVSKKTLRDRFKDYVFPSVAARTGASVSNGAKA